MVQTQARGLFQMANDLATATPGFFETKGPGIGNKATNAYILELGRRASSAFGKDYSEKKICGENSLAVDFYFPAEKTIVEIALGLKKPKTEFEKDILKAVMAQDRGHGVEKLIFISKPGGAKKCNQPGRSAVIEWLAETHGIAVDVLDLG
jgi:hypothetical protein